MIEQQPEDIQEKVKKLATESQKTNPTGWFDVLYSEAEGNAGKIPWARLTTHPYLQKWLDISKLQGKGRTALVIGCGLGDDAEALAKLDFQVTAFDISTKAIAWCQERFPNSSVNYLVADLLALDAQWHRKFDLVLESRTIQALPIEMRSQVIKSIVPLVASGGTLLVITRIREYDAMLDGPPWALSEKELGEFINLGLKEVQRDVFLSEVGEKKIKQVCIEYCLKT
ncbi:Methyltransferase type 12 [Trichodesmium erythraeum IMS101]|uniref:Methyltransferase type 12 n=1 Tax=Trichodesmium erythraeum (strain IMS101) TaxID=203124 RepID=Q10Y16_TRIEI|nr:class I SAM-dependent methyltransferase [Trichodesmium erythraeum GBRTRLIN201]MCH2048603.1 class I SAM-dependent methyltransferase [Trichodesmium sp. ALOHA_ZT_67]MDE5095845.1 methyltransferase domain-containing protein [Trichodesmium sp. St11_bin5]